MANLSYGAVLFTSLFLAATLERCPHSWRMVEHVCYKVVVVNDLFSNTITCEDQGGTSLPPDADINQLMLRHNMTSSKMRKDQGGTSLPPDADINQLILRHNMTSSKRRKMKDGSQKKQTKSILDPACVRSNDTLNFMVFNCNGTLLTLCQQSPTRNIHVHDQPMKMKLLLAIIIAGVIFFIFMVLILYSCKQRLSNERTLELQATYGRYSYISQEQNKEPLTTQGEIKLKNSDVISYNSYPRAENNTRDLCDSQNNKEQNCDSIKNGKRVQFHVGTTQTDEAVKLI